MKKLSNIHSWGFFGLFAFFSACGQKLPVASTLQATHQPEVLLGDSSSTQTADQNVQPTKVAQSGLNLHVKEVFGGNRLGHSELQHMAVYNETAQSWVGMPQTFVVKSPTASVPQVVFTWDKALNSGDTYTVYYELSAAAEGSASTQDNLSACEASLRAASFSPKGLQQVSVADYAANQNGSLLYASAQAGLDVYFLINTVEPDSAPMVTGDLAAEVCSRMVADWQYTVNVTSGGAITGTNSTAGTLLQDRVVLVDAQTSQVVGAPQLLTENTQGVILTLGGWPGVATNSGHYIVYSYSITSSTGAPDGGDGQSACQGLRAYPFTVSQLPVEPASFANSLEQEQRINYQSGNDVFIVLANGLAVDQDIAAGICEQLAPHAP